MNEFGHECWIVETSKDGERWRFFGKAWKEPGEALLLHAVPRYVRVRADGDPSWREPLEASDDMPITPLKLEEGIREELWPDAAHAGLPRLLPGGEIGRLLRFEHDETLGRWTYPLEFRGSHPLSPGTWRAATRRRVAREPTASRRRARARCGAGDRSGGARGTSRS